MRRFLLVMLILLIPSLVFGQAQTTGRVTGTVVDEEGNPISGARVVFISSALQGERVLATSDSGKFLAAILPVGPYSVEISAPSMQPVSFSFRLGVGETVPLDVTLKKGEAIVEEITVYSTASALETTALGENFDYAKQVEELPIQDRLIEDVAQYAPNITYGPTGDNIAISGAPSYDTTVLLDGAEISDPYYGNAPTVYLEDAIEEVQVLTAGVSARYGRFQGGVLNAVTKTGGNNYSGTIRAQLGKETWNSTTPFGEDQSPDLNEFYQGTVGGFILKDHLWWFGGITYLPESAVAETTLTTDTTFANTFDEERWQLKLRGAITPDHVVEVNFLSFEANEIGDTGLDWIGNSAAANGIRSDPREIWTASYQGVLTPNLFLDLQYTKKDVSIAGGGQPGNIDPVLDLSTFRVYNNHWWDATDPSVRNNETAGLNLTQALSTANWGTHTLEYGVQFVQSTTAGENKQSATGLNMLAIPLDPSNLPFAQKQCTDTGALCSVDSDCNPGITCIVADGTIGQPGQSLFNVTTNTQVNYRWKALDASGEQQIDNLAIYVQETWEVNKWRFDAGLRWDDYEGTGLLASQQFDFDDIAPRVGVTYNIDQNWQVQATYGKYLSRFNDNVFNDISGVSAAPRIEHLYDGPSCLAGAGANAGVNLGATFCSGSATPCNIDGDCPSGETCTAAIDPAGDGCDATDIGRILRDDSAWGQVTFLQDPNQATVFNATTMEAPYADDFNFSVKRALPRNSGAIVFTYTQREFKRLLDDFTGAACDDYNFQYKGRQQVVTGTNPDADPSVEPPTQFGVGCTNSYGIWDFDTDPDNPTYLDSNVDTAIWANADNASRDYTAFSVVANWTPSATWGIGGNYTFGKIEGNYEGEGSGTPASGSAIGDHERGYSGELAYPVGTLDEEIRHSARIWGQYRFNFDRAGALVLGSVFSYRSGQVYDHLGDMDRSATPDCAGGANPNPSPGCYASQGGSFTGIFDGRGSFRFQDWWRLDLSARYQIQLWKQLNAWIKVDALNFTNQSVNTQFETTGTVNESSGFPRWEPSAGDFGTIRNEGDYQTPRTWLFTVGLQF